MPAGVVHRPGTALTLEIQQPSDISILLENEMEGIRFTPRQMLAGLDSLEQALEFVDMKASCDKEILAGIDWFLRRSRKSRCAGRARIGFFPRRSAESSAASGSA